MTVADKRVVPAVFGVPRIPPGAIDRPHLIDLLDKRAPLTVIRGAGGRGKTTLVAQWLSHGEGLAEAAVWIDLEPAWRRGENPWPRVIEALGHVGLIGGGEVARNLTVMSSDEEQIPEVLRRVFMTLRAPVLLVLDGVPSPDGPGVAAWVHEVIDLLRAASHLRCIVISQSPDLFAGPRARSQVEMVTIDDEQLALTEAEADHMIAAHGQQIDASARKTLIELTTGGTAAELRYLLALLDTPGVDVAKLARGEAPTDVADLVRRDVLHTAANDAGWRFMGLISFGTAVTPQLAVELTGDPNAEDILNAWVHAGMGHWTTLPHVGKAFRMADVLRSSASADLVRNHPNQAREARRKTALWLLDEAHDPKAALREALDADHLDLVERAFINAFPFTAPEGERELTWLEQIPAHRIHRHPFLALYRALQLNAKAATRMRAIEYFLSATLVGKFKPGRVAPLEQAFRISLEGTTWRALGRETTMVARARAAIEIVHDTQNARPEQWIPSITLWTIQQAATSLFCAGLMDEAMDAIDLLEQEATAQESQHFVALARGARALVQVLEGEVVEARKTLATVSENVWPNTVVWKNGYMQSMHIMAIMRVQLHDGEPEKALATLARLDPHADTIEFWDLLLEAQVYALMMLGRQHEAEYVFRRVRQEREERRTLSLARARLDFVAHLLALGGTSVAVPAKVQTVPYLHAPLRAVSALTELGSSRPERAVALVVDAESSAESVSDYALVSAVGIAVGHGAGESQMLQRNAARLASISEKQQIFLSVALLTETEREAALTALEDASAPVDPALQDKLAQAFERVPALTARGRATPVQLPELTPSEHELLVLLATEATRDEIAQARFVSVNTVKTQLRSLYAKLGANTRADAVAKALASGVLSADEIPTSD